MRLGLTLLAPVSFLLAGCISTPTHQPPPPQHTGPAIRMKIAVIVLRGIPYLFSDRMKVVHATITAPKEYKDTSSQKTFTRYCVEAALDAPILNVSFYAEVEVHGAKGLERIEVTTSQQPRCIGSNPQPFNEIQDLRARQIAAGGNS